MTKRSSTLVAALVVLVLGLSSCGGSSGDTATKGESAQDVLAAAKAKFDDAGSVRLHLETQSRPSSGNGILAADGYLTDAPGFKGEVEVLFSGLRTKVPVVAVDGLVYAKLPFTPGYSKIDPKDFGAPDPASFIDPAAGISALLTEMTGARLQAEKRDKDTGTVLTTYSGKLAGDRIAAIIPTADTGTSYDTRVGIDGEGRISTIAITGQFFPGDDNVTYAVKLTDYDKSVKISKP